MFPPVAKLRGSARERAALHGLVCHVGSNGICGDLLGVPRPLHWFDTNQNYSWTIIARCWPLLPRPTILLLFHPWSHLFTDICHSSLPVPVKLLYQFLQLTQPDKTSFNVLCSLPAANYRRIAYWREQKESSLDTILRCLQYYQSSIVTRHGSSASPTSCLTLPLTPSQPQGNSTLQENGVALTSNPCAVETRILLPCN